MRTAIFATLLLLLTLFDPRVVRAEDFPGFQVGAAAGWVETNQTPTNRIKVLPILSGPGGVYWSTAADPWGFAPYDPKPEGIALMGDGRLQVGFRIVTSARYLPPGFREAVASQIGVPPQSLAQHVVAFVRPRSVTVSFEVAGRVVDTRSYQADLLGEDLTDHFYVDMADDALVSAIRRGEYRFQMQFRADYASYGLVEISLDQRILTTAWTEAFRELIKQRRSSSSGFLFFKFRDEVQRVIARENLRSGASTNVRQTLAITRVDADPAQTALIDRAIGILESSKAEIVQLHTAALAAARAANDPKLAAAHEKYLENLSSDPGGNTDWLAALQQLTDDKVLSFLASGFQASEGSSYSYYRYTGSSRLTVDTTASTQYADYLIRNSEVGLSRLVPGTPDAIGVAFGHVRARYFGAYGPSSPQQWAAGVRGIIQANDLGGLKYAYSDAFRPGPQGNTLMPLIDVEADLDANRNHALHLAVDRHNRGMIDFLLAQGADPGAPNRFQETPLDRARTWGDTSAVAALQAAQRQAGTIRIRVTTPAAALIGSQTLLPLGKPSRFQQVSATETTIEVSGFPGLINGQWMINYRAMVPAQSLSALTFPYTPVGQNGSNVIIEYAVMVQNEYKIFPGETRTYDETIGVKNGVLMNL